MYTKISCSILSHIRGSKFVSGAAARSLLLLIWQSCSAAPQSTTAQDQSEFVACWHWQQMERMLFGCEVLSFASPHIIKDHIILSAKVGADDSGGPCLAIPRDSHTFAVPQASQIGHR